MLQPSVRSPPLARSRRELTDSGRALARFARTLAPSPVAWELLALWRPVQPPRAARRLGASGDAASLRVRAADPAGPAAVPSEAARRDGPDPLRGLAASPTPAVRR